MRIAPGVLEEDVERGVVYRRRDWLDAWTIVCKRHGCPLGQYEDDPLLTTECELGELFSVPALVKLGPASGVPW